MKCPAGTGKRVVCRKIGTGGSRVRHDRGVLRQAPLQCGDHALWPYRVRVRLCDRVEAFELAPPDVGGRAGPVKRRLLPHPGQFPRSAHPAPAADRPRRRPLSGSTAPTTIGSMSKCTIRVPGPWCLPARCRGRSGAAAHEDYQIRTGHRLPGLVRAAVRPDHRRRSSDASRADCPARKSIVATGNVEQGGQPVERICSRRI